MRITLVCMTCSMAEGRATAISWGELTESGVHRFVCPHGHDNWICLQEPRFELLFDLGVAALLDGYYREAVSSFSGALERFHEFYIRVAALERGIPKTQLDDAWKLISNQSERQFGAFTFVALLLRNVMPAVLQEKSAGFRNRVIHKGYFPTRAEAEQFGRDILQLIDSDLEFLKQQCETGIGIMRGELARQVQSNVPKGINPVILGYPTTLASTRSGGARPSFEDALENVGRSRKAWLAALSSRDHR